MISRFVQTSFILICMCGYTCAQTTSSFYIRMVNADDAEKAMSALRQHFPEAEITRPFARNTFERLNHIIRFDGNGGMDEIKSMISVPIIYIEPVPMGNLSFTPNDLGVEFGSPNQWYLHKVNAEGAWDYSKGSPSVVVAVVDNAFLVTHDDLVEKVVINNGEIPGDDIDNDNNGFVDDFAGWNSRLNDGSVSKMSTNSNHGTHVAGIAAAETNNHIGIASLSFRSLWLPIAAANADDVITHGYEGIAFAAERGAKVISCSWGSFDSSATAKSVINFALSKNCFVVASAGNFSNELPVYPATYQGVISVASTTPGDAKLNTSSFGRRVNISAPGSGIWSTSSSESGASDYEFMSGTSMASPLTAALLALMSGYAPAGNDSVILHCLYSTAADIYGIPANSAYDSLLGTGRIDAESAMLCLNETLHLHISESEPVFSVNVYPNPSSGRFYIIPHTQASFSAHDIVWTLKDISGKNLMQGQSAQGNISHISSGIYFLCIEDKKYNKSYTHKLIKK